MVAMDKESRVKPALELGYVVDTSVRLFPRKSRSEGKGINEWMNRNHMIEFLMCQCSTNLTIMED